MTYERFLARRRLVSNLGTSLLILCVAEMSARLVEMIAVGVFRVDGSQGFGFEMWRWLAWGPALLYLVTVAINFPMPPTSSPEVRWYLNGKFRVIEFGRGMLIFVGAILAIFCTFHSVMFLPDYSKGGAASEQLQYVLLALLGILLLRIVLGWLRLVPRSWRVEPEPPGEPGSMVERAPLRLPPQRFAPPRVPGTHDG